MLLSFNIYLETGEGGMIYSKVFSWQTLEKRNHLINQTQIMESISSRQKTWNLKPGTVTLCSEEETTKSQQLLFFKELMDLDALKYPSFFLKVKNIEKTRESKGGTEPIASLIDII